MAKEGAFSCVSTIFQSGSAAASLGEAKLHNPAGFSFTFAVRQIFHMEQKACVFLRKENSPLGGFLTKV